MEDATFFVDEEAGASVAAVFTGVVIFNGETCEGRDTALEAKAQLYSDIKS